MQPRLRHRRLGRTKRRILRTLRRGIVLRPEHLDYSPPVPTLLRDQLLAYNPTVIAHRAGNHPSSLRYALAAGAAVSELDARPRNGRLVVGHEHWFGPFAFDYSQRLLRLQPRSFPLDRLLYEAWQLDGTLMLDLKFVEAKWVEVLLKLVREHVLSDRVWFTGQWRALDAVAIASGESRRFYGVNTPKQLKRFFAAQTVARRSGVSLNKRLASSGTIAALHGAGVEVFVYTVSNPDEALAVLEAGADGLITNDLSLVGLYAQARRPG